MSAFAYTSKMMLSSLTIAAIAALSLPNAASANSITMKTHPFSTLLVCRAPMVLQKVCTSWGPASPGKLFGPCIAYQVECQSKAYTGQ